MSFGHLTGKRKKVKLTDTSLVALVNHLLQKHRHPNGKPRIETVRKALGWNQQQWNLFTKRASRFLVFDYVPEFEVLDGVAADPEATTESLQKRGIQTEEISKRIAITYGTLRSDLMGIGLAPHEVEGALAMQNFGANRFSDAMEMVSTGVFKTAVKLQTQQDIVEERLKFVRKQIEEHGPFLSEELDAWNAQEQRLMKQYLMIGDLLSKIQDTWYQGSAQLALVRMKMRESGTTAPNGAQTTQRLQKPGFRPTVVDVEPVPRNGEPQHEEGTDQAGAEAAPP